MKKRTGNWSKAWTSERRKAQSEKMKGNNIMKDYWTPERKKAQSEKMKGHNIMKDPEIRKAQSERMKKNNPMKDPEVARKVAEQNTGEGGIWYGKKRPEHSELLKGERNPAWRGGSPTYETYAPQLSFAEDVRRDPEQNEAIQVRCTYGGEWFTPTLSQVNNRVGALNGREGYRGEYRFYCSDNCRAACPIFGQRLWPKDHKPATSREVQAELRQLVLARDGWECQYGDCGKTVDDDELHCHHFEGINLNPIESADMDMCITFCKEHHLQVHDQNDCRYFELTCNHINKAR